jgi:hypothetical protein
MQRRDLLVAIGKLAERLPDGAQVTIDFGTVEQDALLSIGPVETVLLADGHAAERATFTVGKLTVHAMGPRRPATGGQIERIAARFAPGDGGAS